MIKFAFIQLKRQKIRSLILFLVFFLMLTGLMGTYVLLNSAEKSKDSVIEKIGASVTVDYCDAMNEDAIFTTDIINVLADQKHVIGCNQTYSDYATPLNFQNCRRYDGENPSTQPVSMELEPGTCNYIVLEGDSNLQLIDLFRKGNAQLIDGSFPSESNPGVIISAYLAEDNGVQPGDVLTFASLNGTDSAALTVTGIYQTEENFIITDENIVGESVFAYSPYNRVYADLDTAAAFFSIDKEALYVTVYIDDPRNVTEVAEQMKATDINWDIYSLVNTTQATYTAEATQIEATISMAKTMLLFILGITVATIILVTSIWGEQSRFESGIFLALGATKWYALCQEIVTTLTVAIPAYLFALICAKPTAGILMKIKETISVKNSSVHNQFLTGLEASSNITLTSIDVPDAALCALFTAFVVTIACLIPAWCIFKMKPREILAQR